MKLFYRKYGNGPPLIILHGLYGSSDNWVSIARRLSDNFMVLLPDQRNHGQSPHNPVHNYDVLCQDLYELVTDLQIKKFTLAGHSMGGKVVMQFAMKWPDMINSLIIIDITPFKPENPAGKQFQEHKHILESVLSTEISATGSRQVVELSLANKIVSEKTRSFILKNLRRTGENSFAWKMNPQSLYNNLDKIIDGLPRPEKGGEPVTGFPITFIRGEESDYLPREEVDSILKLFPAAEIVNVKNAGHWVHADRPDEIIRIFLQQLNG